MRYPISPELYKGHYQKKLHIDLNIWARFPFQPCTSFFPHGLSRLIFQQLQVLVSLIHVQGFDLTNLNGFCLYLVDTSCREEARKQNNSKFPSINSELFLKRETERVPSSLQIPVAGVKHSKNVTFMVFSPYSDTILDGAASNICFH